MIYIYLSFYIFVVLSLLLYYLLPLDKRWILLLCANIFFYMFFLKNGWPVFLLTVFFTYMFGRILFLLKGQYKKVLFLISIISVILPWFSMKSSSFISNGFITPIGISFYTLQLISYLADIFAGRIIPQKNIFKYALYVSFFPQMIQGPIPRYAQLQEQLTVGHLFDEEEFVRGFYLIIWGFFLKLVIADKAAVIVNQIFDAPSSYNGIYIWIASVLYSIQLYTDFLACTTLSQGVSRLFGIHLADNFARPYFAVSIKDFWRRWHISLSSWLRDYVYIPLGGSRKGKFVKYVNLFITFLISGIWHGTGTTFLIWCMIHSFYQIMGEMPQKTGGKPGAFFRVPDDSKARTFINRLMTFILVNFAWIIFRADTLTTGSEMIKQMFANTDPRTLWNGQLFSLGLCRKEVVVLILAIVLLWMVEKKQEQGMCISERIRKQKLPIRWLICLSAILAILIVGTYGFGFDVQDFIYGGF